MRAVRAWLETARIGEGPIFRPLDRFQRVQPTRLSAERVALIVNAERRPSGWIPVGTPATRSGRDWPPVPRQPELLKG